MACRYSLSPREPMGLLCFRRKHDTIYHEKGYISFGGAKVLRCGTINVPIFPVNFKLAQEMFSYR